MDAEFFSQRVNAFQKRVTSLFDRLQGPDLEHKVYIQESFMELAKALEELETAEEELNVQATELEQFRLQAETEHDNYLGLLQFCPDGYLITDSNGVIRLANPAACRMLNKAMQYLVGKPLVNWIAEPDRRTFRRLINRMLNDGNIQNFEMHIDIRRQRATPVFNFTAGPVRSGLGDVKAIRWLIRDIMPLKEEGQPPATAADRFSAIFETAPVGIQLLDRNGFTLSANPAVERLLGYDQKVLKSLSFVDYVAPDDLERLVTLYTRLSHHEIDRFRLKVKLMTKTRGGLQARLSITQYKSSGDPAGFAIATIEDLIDHKEIGKKTAEDLELSFKNSLVLRQSFARDLKTGPLEDLSLILHRLENISQPDPEQIGELEEIRMALQYTLATLTEKVNDLTANGRPAPFDLQEAITGFMEQLKWEKPSLTYSIEFDPILHSVPEPTRLELFNIFSMIIQNRMRQHRPAWFELHAHHNQDAAILEIQDNGPSESVPAHPEELIREGLFEFAQAIEQAEKLHGHISSEGAMDSRSAIQIVIPWKQQQAKEPGDQTKKSKQKGSLGERKLNNKPSSNKLMFEGPFDPPDNQHALYIPYDRDDRDHRDQPPDQAT